MNFGEAKELVEEGLIEVPTSTLALIGQFINSATRTAEDRHNFRYMEATVVIATVAETRLLGAKPATWKEAWTSPQLATGTGSLAVNDEIEWAPSLSEMVRQFPGTDGTETSNQGEPEFILENETDFHVYPFPDDAYNVTLPHYAYSADMVNDGDEGAILGAQFGLYAVYYAIHLGAVWNEDDAKAAKYLQMATRELNRAISRDKLSRLPSRYTLTPRRDVYGAAIAPRSRWTRR